MAILESVRKLAEKLGAETNGRDITDQLNKINEHLDETALGGRDIAEAVSKFADTAGGGSTGTPIMATPTAVADAVNTAKRVITLKGGDYVRLPSGEGRNSPSGTQYYAFTTPISAFTFVNPSNVGESAIVIFTCGENMQIKYYNGSSYKDVCDEDSNAVADSMVAGKTYRLGVTFTNVQGSISKVEAYSVDEYDEPITYSVE